VPPGSKMTYDSENYIQHISYTLSTVARKKGMQGAYEYVKKLFAEPIGLPTLFDYDATGTEFSAGGGQMMSCRDIARVGQVFLNKGMWLDANSKPYQMSDPTYLAQMVEPAFPGVVDGYGLLTWLNTDMRKPADDKGTPRSHCCAPRWANGKGTQPSGAYYATCCEAAPGYNASSIPCDINLPVLPERPCSDDPQVKCIHACDPSEYVVTQNLGDSFPNTDKIVASEKIGFGMGQFAKYIFLVPELNLTVSTFGQSTGHSLGCDGGYDDGYTLSLIWNAIQPALLGQGFTPEMELEYSMHPVAPKEASYLGTPRAQGDRTKSSLAAEAEQYRKLAANPAPAGAPEVAGSCTCTCPPGEGFGKCFNVPAAEMKEDPATLKDGDSCSALVMLKLPPAYDWCPAVGYPTQCQPSEVGTNVCGDSKVHVSDCAFVGDSKTFATAGCRDTIPKSWSSGWGSSCQWSTSECTYNPFFPPPYDL